LSANCSVDGNSIQDYGGDFLLLGYSSRSNPAIAVVGLIMPMISVPVPAGSLLNFIKIHA